MESDIDVARCTRDWSTRSFSKRFKTFTDMRPTCISVQNADDDINNITALKNVQNCVADENAVDDDDDDDNTDDKVRRHLPLATGPYSVGCVDIMDNNSEDGCFFRLFYPVEKTDVLKRNTQWPLWLPRKQYGFGYAYFLKKPKLMGKLFNWLGGDVYIPTLWQAPILESDDKYPVVVMSHGIGGNRTTYSTFCCELASHGIIVAVQEHRDGSASMTYSLKDNMKISVVELIKENDCGKHNIHAFHKSYSFSEEWRSFEHTDPLGIQWDDFEYRNKQVHHRADECSRLLDVLVDINKGRSVRNFLGFQFSLKQFKGRLDISKVAIVGHSFGGSTCVTTLGQDKRFKVGVMLDAWMHPLTEELCKKVTQPLLMVNYEKFQWQKNVKQMTWLQRDDVARHMITIREACHQAMSDFQFLSGRTFGKLMEVRSDLSPKVSMDLNKRATLGFLSKHLGIDGWDSGDDVLSGSHAQVVLGTTLDVT